MKYITNLFGGSCVALFAMLFITPGAFAQITTLYVDTVNGADATCTDITTPCTLTAALADSRDGDVVAVRVRRQGGSVTIDGNFDVENSITIAAYLRGSGELVEGTLNFTGTVTIDGNNVQFGRHEDVTVLFEDVVTTDTSDPDPFDRDTEGQGAYLITGSWTAAAGVYGTLVVERDLTLKSATPPTDAAVTVFVVDTLEVKSGATLTLGMADDDRIDLRVRLQKAFAADSKVDDMVVAGTIGGTGEIWLAYGSNENRAVDHDDNTATDPVNAFHTPGEYEPDAADNNKVDHLDCMMISGGGTIGVKITAVAAGNVCVDLSEISDFVAAGSITVPNPATALATTDVIFRSDIMVAGSVYQWGDARVVFEKRATIDGSVILDNGAVPTGFDGGIPSGLGSVRTGALNVNNNEYIRTTMIMTEAAAEVSEVLGDNPDTPDITETDFVITPAVPAVDAAFYTCEQLLGDRTMSSRGGAFSGIQFEADGNRIENDLSLRFDAATTRETTDSDPTDNEADELAICKTQVVFWAPAGSDKDVNHMTTLSGDLYIENGGTVHLDGASLGNDPDVVTHNLNLERDIYVDGANGGFITMGMAADSNINGECTTDASLGKGNRVTLTAGSNHVIVTADMGLTIETLVVLDELEVQGGSLQSTVVHISGELVSDGDVQIGAADNKGSLILEGDGLDGTLHMDSNLGKLTYASTGDELPLSGIDIVSINPGTGYLRIEDPATIHTLGLCSGELVLVDTGDNKTNTLTVTSKLTVKDGEVVLDSNAPGDIVGDMADEAHVDDGYLLMYVTDGAREVGLELSGARDLAVNHVNAVITLTGEATLRGKLHILKGKLSTMGDLTVGASSAAADRFLTIHDGELNSNGNDVFTHASVTVGASEKEVAKLITGGGDLHVLGNNNNDNLYNDGTAMATVGAKGMIDVRTGRLQLGPAYAELTNGLEAAARPDVSLTVNKTDSDMGMVKGMIHVPIGSKETRITGEAFDVIVLDGTGNPLKDPKALGNWGGGLYFHDRNVVIDSLVAMNDAAVEFYDNLGNADDSFTIEIKKDVVLNSARIYVNQKNELKFGGNFTVGETGGLRTWDDSKVTVMGDFTQDAGSQHAGHQDGVGLVGSNTFTAMGDFMVADGAHRFETQTHTNLILKGDFHFGKVTTGSDKVLAASLEFSGTESQTVSSAVDLGDVEVNNSKGIMLGGNVMQGTASTLTLTRGIISDMGDHAWIVKNPNIEEDLQGRNNALMTCATDANCDSVIKGGSRRAHVSAGVSRHVEQGNSGAGEMSGGYLFPVGGMDGDMSHYRPLILQFEDDLLSKDTVTVSPVMVPEDAMPDWPADNILVPTLGGLLTLDAHSDIFWRVEFAEGVNQDPHIRVAAGGLANVFDVDGLRMVQWDCDWSNPRLAGTQIIGTNEESFAENGYVNGVPNITQESVEVGMCTILGVAANGTENPIHLDPIAGGLSRVQFIHNVPLPAPVNLSLDGVRLQSNMEFRSATGYAIVGSGSHEATVSIVGAPAEQAIDVPLSLAPDGSYVVVAHGSLTNYGIDVLETRLTSLADNMVDAILVHGSADLGEVDVRTVDTTPDHAATALLANNIEFGESTNYLSLDPGLHNIQVISSDGTEEIDVFEVSLGGYQGETVVLNLSGSKAVPGIGFEIFGVDIQGETIQTQMVTGVEDEREELPTEFTLHGNYPNPFNPSTRIQFDLPETAQVSLQIVDMLGREVMTLPAKEFEAGSNRSIELNAVNLASGTYLYRMIATGAESRYVKTGRMTLVK